MAVVTGRLIKQPITTIDIAGECVRIRVDDDANPEFWLEVLLNVHELNMICRRLIDRKLGVDVLPFSKPETPGS